MISLSWSSFVMSDVVASLWVRGSMLSGSVPFCFLTIYAAVSIFCARDEMLEMDD